MGDGPCQRNMDVESDGGQECHEASGCVQMVECLTPVQMCGSGEKDRRTEDTGGSDPEFGDLEEVGDMMECTGGWGVGGWGMGGWGVGVGVGGWGWVGGGVPPGWMRMRLRLRKGPLWLPA